MVWCDILIDRQDWEKSLGKTSKCAINVFQ